MPTNDFLPFASGAGANAISQADYLELVSLRAAGFTSGTAKSAELNKVWRQSSMMAHVLAQFISDANAVDVLDDGNAATLLAALKSVIRGSVATISASASLVASQSGMVLLNATSGNVTVTLPAANAALGVSEFTIRRTDATTNTAAIAASGSDRIMLDTIAAAAGLASTELLFSGDYLRLRSDGAGKWWCVGQAQLPGSIATGLRVFSAPGVSSFAVPPVLRSGRRRAKVIVTGGGGGTADLPSVTTGNTALSAAAGAGATAIKAVDLSGVTTVSVTVGAAGLRAASVGGNGGTSSFGAYCTAGGGSGTSAITVAGTTTSQGGTGGTASGGDINLNGGDGSSVYSNGGSFTPVVNGNGGSSYWGGGPGAYASATVRGTGGGSSENQVGDPAALGLNGAPGIVTVEW